MNWPALANGVLAAASLILAVAGGWRAARGFAQVPNQPDFATYYLAAGILNTSPAALYDEAALARLAPQKAVPNYAPPYVYPPLFAAALRPLATLPYRLASRLWLAMNLAALTVSSLVLVRLAGFRARPPALLCAVAAVLLFPPVHQALMLGQVSPLLLVLCATSLYLALWPGRRKFAEAASGALLATATLVKVYPGLLLPYPIASKRWRVSAYGAIALVAGLLLGILWGGGVGNTLDYFGRVLPSLYGQRLDIARPDNQSLSAFFLRLLNPTHVQVDLLAPGSSHAVELAPLARVSALALPATALGSALILGATGAALLRARRRLQAEDGWALGYGVLLMLPLLLVSSAYYHFHVLFLLPMAILVRTGLEARRWGLTALALLAYLLAVIQRYWNWLAVLTSSAWFVSFGLYSGLLLWASLLYALLSPRVSAPAIQNGLPAAEER